jgi:hypothetical protein
MNTILETYPDANPSALMTGSDDMLHFTDIWGESWCSTSFTDYFIGTLNEELELFEKVDDGKLDEFCPGCKEACDEEED